MKICFVLNSIPLETCQTSVLLIKKAHQRGHQVYVMGVCGFIFNQTTGISLRCKKIPDNLKATAIQDFWEQVQHKSTAYEVVPSKRMDIVFLRNNPTEEPNERCWAQHSGVAFGRMIQESGVLVLNDAFGLSHAFIDKLYFEELPAAIKPNSLITRNREEILKFWEENNYKMVLKPLEGSGGKNVYKIGKRKSNLNQIIQTIQTKGYVIAQEYIPESKEGDIRVILMNGKILEENGEQAIIHRTSMDKTEFRNNLSLGAIPKKGSITPAIEHIVSLIAPKLVRDGLFFVGLDIVQDKLLELNILSPGGIDHGKVTGMTDFADTIIAAIERKLQYKKESNNQLSNRILATME